MTTPRYAIVPASFTEPKPVSFTVTNSTIAKVLVEPLQAAAAVAEQPPFQGGSTLLDMTASSSDAAAKDVILYLGRILTTQSVGATGNITLTAQNVLTRATAGYLTDGWVVGDPVMLFTPFGTAQVAAGIDGILGIVTAVTNTVLTVNGTPFAAGTNVLTAGTRLVNVGQLFRTTIAANAGNASATPNVPLLGNANDNAVIKTELKLSSTTMLIAAMQAAVAALPAVVSITPRLARY